MALLSNCLSFCLLALSLAAHASGGPGLRFFHQDWELACDNTRTCRAAGYHGDAGELHAVSVLLTRAAGPGERVTGRLMIGQYGENEVVDGLPEVFSLTMRINDRVAGRVAVEKSSLTADLAPAHVAALLDALVRNSRIELTFGDHVWELSDKGAAAVLLKMDEFQGRIGTPGALARKGRKTEATVLPALPVPTVTAARVPKPSPADDLFAKTHAGPLREALRKTIRKDVDYCPELVGEDQAPPQEGDLYAFRLTDSRMLVSTRCWVGAYNAGHGYWVVDTAAPYRPVLVTTSGSDYDDGSISASHKGRGLGDCWSTEEWTWDGKAFVHTVSSSSGMCRLMAAGGTWSMPTIVVTVVGKH